MHTIYRILNTITEQSYVGKTNNVPKRWEAHRRSLRKGDHHSYKLQAAYTEHGENAFQYEIVEKDIDEANVSNREGYWIKKFNCYYAGYNVRYIAFDGNGEIHFTEEVQKLGIDPFHIEQIQSELKEQLRQVFEKQVNDMRDEMIRLKAAKELIEDLYDTNMKDQTNQHYVISVLCRTLDRNNIPMPKFSKLSDKFRETMEFVHKRLFEAEV